MSRRCRVTVLGRFEVRVDDDVVPVDAWRSRRAADLVKILALAPDHRLHREQVMDALWPDLPADAAGANLRKSVHYARKALGDDDAVHAGSGLLALFPDGGLSVDVDDLLEEARAALASGSPEACAAVAARYPGEVLPADRYEPWAEGPRARVRAQLLALLKAAGDWERVLELDPTDEEAHRALMEEHLRAGRRREAIRQFEHLRDALREHIGVGPDAATVALYEQVLEMEPRDPPTAAQRAATLLAHGLVAWGRRDLAEAERLAREARELARAAELSHEVGEASTLLALIAYARGTWHDLFREEFTDSVTRSRVVEAAVLDAHLCFSEFYLYGPDGHAETEDFARELLAVAERAGSGTGRALATLLLGEFQLLSGDAEAAARTLSRAVELADGAACVSASSIALERLAEAEVARGNRDRARRLLARARLEAGSSAIPSHLVVRVLAVEVAAADGPVDALKIATDAEHVLMDAPRVCEPCSMNFRVEAARAFARSGDLTRARRQIAEADRVTALWQGGPWKAAVWEARAELRRAEGHEDQAKALFLEAADGFAQVRRPADEARCRAAAGAAAGV